MKCFIGYRLLFFIVISGFLGSNKHFGLYREAYATKKGSSYVRNFLPVLLFRFYFLKCFKSLFIKLNWTFYLFIFTYFCVLHTLHWVAQLQLYFLNIIVQKSVSYFITKVIRKLCQLHLINVWLSSKLNCLSITVLFSKRSAERAKIKAHVKNDTFC